MYTKTTTPIDKMHILHVLENICRDNFNDVQIVLLIVFIIFEFVKRFMIGARVVHINFSLSIIQTRFA